MNKNVTKILYHKLNIRGEAVTIDIDDPDTFSHVNFPDGQRLFRWNPNQTEAKLKYLIDFANSGTPLIIKTRLTWDNLQILMQAFPIFRRLGFQKIYLFCPWITGARSDRQFAPNESHYLREVVHPVMSGLSPDGVLNFDPHSTILESVIPNFHSVTPGDLAPDIEAAFITRGFSSESVVVAPDQGALKRTEDFLKHIVTKPHYVSAIKNRDIYTGEILGIGIPNPEVVKGRDTYIIDDICDGGRTFTELANLLRHHGAKSVHLYVSHGIFSKGLPILFEYLDSITTTDSYYDGPSTDTRLTVINL